MRSKEEIKATEQAHEDGRRGAIAEVLTHVVNKLQPGERTNLEKLGILAAEREAALITIRKLCVEQNRSTDWGPDLHLSDIIEKHLMRPAKK